jgi:hypothetical protein
MRTKPRKAKPLPPFFPEKEIQPLIEAGTELRKETLIERAVGRVNYSVLTLLKMMQLYSIRKDQDGNLSIL